MIPLFSVIIPYFERDNLVVEAVRSVLAQSYTNYEIILVDDGSSYMSEPLRQIIEQEPAIVYISQQHSGFPGQVRNVGAAQARGDWLAFLDSDDVWYAQKLQRCKEFIDTNGSACPLIHSRERWVRNGRVVSQRKQRHQRQGDIFVDALKKCIIGPSTTVIRKDIYHKLGGFREDLEIAEDYEFWLRYCNRYRVAYIDEPLVEKRAGHWNQLSTKYDEIEIFRIEGLKDLVDRKVFTLDHQLLATQELGRKCHIYATGAQKRGNLQRALRYKALAEQYGHA